MNVAVDKIISSMTQRWPLLLRLGRYVEIPIRFLQYRRIRLTQLAWIPSLTNPRHAFRFLWAGVLLSIAVCLVGVVAINTNTGLLYLLVGLMLGAWIVSALFSTFNLVGLTVTRSVSHTSMVGETLTVTYTITNSKRFFRSYSIVLEELGRLPLPLPWAYVMSIAPGQRLRCSVNILCRRRGHMRLRRIRISSRFPFGLADKCVVVDEAADVVVHPSIGRIRYELLNKATPSASGSLGQYNQQTKGFEEFYGIREFHNYDNYHWIHWRTSAKLGILTVKEMAEYNSNQLTVVLDTRVEDPLSLTQQYLLEQAISFAASIIDRATERSLPVALVVTGGDMKLIKHGRGTGHRWSVMTELAGVRMGSWSTELPNPGSFRPRSFADAHYWIVGVGLEEHADELGRYGTNRTVIDVKSPRFDQVFTNEKLAALNPAESASEVHR